MIRLRLPAIVDANTSSGLPEPTDAPGLVIDFADCRVFGADGYAWLGRLLTLGHRIRIEHAPVGFADRVRVLVPARLDADELMLP